MSFHGAGHTLLRRPKRSNRRIGLVDMRSLTLFKDEAREAPGWIANIFDDLPLTHRIVEVASRRDLPAELSGTELPILQHGPEVVVGIENISGYIRRLKKLAEAEQADGAKDARPDMS